MVFQVFGSHDRSFGRAANPLRFLFSREPWSAFVFALLSFPLGLFWFVALITLVSVGGSLLFIVVGLPILAGTILFWIAGARLERERIRHFLGVHIPAPYRALPAGNLLIQGWTLTKDPAVWRDLLYLLLLFPIGIAEFVVGIVLLSVSLPLLTIPLWFWVSPEHPPAFFSNGATTVMAIDTLPKALIISLLGLAFTVASAYAIAGVGRLHATFAKLLLGPNEVTRLSARVDELSLARSRSIDAAMLERRRIERDLHDGAQQRLVALAMDLGMAREKLSDDPAAAQALVDDAHEEAKRVLVEIRDLARGIHPAVLTDRGLDPAISALAGRCPVPVTVDVDLQRRPPEVVESAAYFVVSEALANVAKHSDASQAWVNVYRLRDMLVVEVADNGIGGARPGRNSGLTGLADRVAALDGRLTLESPEGGPTRIRAEIPYGL